MHHGNTRPGGSPDFNDLREYFSSLSGVFRQFGRAHGQRNAYMYLWRLAECRANTVHTSYLEISAEYGIDPRSVKGWVAGLEERGLVEVLDDNSGQLLIYVEDPNNTVRRAKAPDPQQSLFDEDAGVSAQKPPGALAQKPPAAISQDSAQTPTTIQLWADSPAAGESEAAQKPPRSPMEPLSRNAFQPSGIVNPIDARRERGEAERLADFALRSIDEQRRAETTTPAPVHESLSQLVERIKDGATPHKRRERIRDQVMRRVRDPEMHEAIAAKAADYVVHDGLPEKDLWRILDEIDTADRAGKIKRSRGALFNHKLRRAIAGHGIEERVFKKKD